MARLRLGVVIAAVFALLAPGSAWARDVQVVVVLDEPGLAEARMQSRVLSTAAKERRLELSSLGSRSYLSALNRGHALFEARLRKVVRSAVVYRRYRIVFNGVAVSLPARELPRLRRLGDVYPNARYTRLLDRSVPMIGAPSLWPSTGGGAGAKIAILDDGIDQTHAFFSPAGYTMPAGFPKGQTSHTTAKVIVARAFVPRGVTWPASRLPFDPQLSFHGTHVAGIAAGNADTPTSEGARVSGAAPRAYLGNYKVLTVPTEEFGLNGNAPEIAAGVEAAVADGMDVINLSLGQPEIEPSRDILARAIEGAAAAGVPTVAAAGNEFGRFTLGSVGSPGAVASAITAGAISTGRTGPIGIASFSSSGPTPVSLRFKPELVAPGTEILSAAPGNDWSRLSGTSMAAPHVTGAVALLRLRHPTWTPAQLKSALVTTAAPAPGTPLRTGAGVANVPAADVPLLFAEPSALALGIVRPGTTVSATVRLTDAGGGAGTWNVSGATGLPATVTVPGELTFRYVTHGVPDGEDEFFITLSRAGVTRKVPVWVGVATPRLPRPSGALARTGTYRGSTVGRPARVQTYRYPETAATLRGPEQVFRVRIRRPVANFGVAVTAGAVQPRIVRAGDEHRLLGFTALPFNLNPYLDRYGTPQPVAAAIRPAAGAYDVVFDSPARGSRFTFRFWVDDTQPPSARLVSARSSGGALRVRVSDAGSGVDPRSMEATVDGTARPVRYSRGIASVDARGLRSGPHDLVFFVSDNQEAKNMENVAVILPNTRALRATFRVP